MKKIISLLFVALMSVFLCACGGNESEISGKNAIIGEWKSLSGNVAKFDKDGTINGGTKWKYDEELDCFSYTSKAGINVNLTIKEDEDVRYFTILNQNYYYIDDYEKVASSIESKKNMTADELKQYYDADTYTGAPRVEVFNCSKNTEEETKFVPADNSVMSYKVDYNENYKVNKDYACIIVEGGSEEYDFDDELVYVFIE